MQGFLITSLKFEESDVIIVLGVCFFSPDKILVCN